MLTFPVPYFDTKAWAADPGRYWRNAPKDVQVQRSYRVVTSTPGAMAVWAVLIVALTAFGVATAFVGFAVVFPVWAYATWHSYRATVK